MCLYKTHTFPKIAKKDIVVYKLLYKDLTTMYTNDKIEIGKTYKGIFKKYTHNKDEAHSPNFIKSLFSGNIDTGYIHSYKYPKPLYNFLIIKCIIPKGILYFKNEVWGEYASRKIKYIEIMNPEILIKN